MTKQPDWSKIGKANSRHGKAFERQVAKRPAALGMSLMLKWIDRTLMRGVSLPDIECPQFPDLRIDCKYTETYFTPQERVNLLAEAIRKYGSGTVVVIGERRGKPKLNFAETLVLFVHPCGMMMMYLDDFLRFYDDQLKSI